MAELEAVVADQAAQLEAQGAELEAQAAQLVVQAELIARLEAKVVELERRLGQNSGNSGLPPSRDPATERERQATQRQKRKQDTAGGKRRPGKQPGTKGSGPSWSESPDEVIEYRVECCAGCGHAYGPGDETGFEARQVIDLPEIVPVVTEHRAVEYECGCGHKDRGSFPAQAKGRVCYGPRVRAVVVYLLARQHIPNRRVAETMADLFNLDISGGTIDSIYGEAARRLSGFIRALVALLRSLPVLHADETTDRVATTVCWMHVVSTRAYTLIHASATRGFEAVTEAGVLVGYTGVVIHDRLALYWKLKAKHGVCGAHLLRDLTDVAEIASQTEWAAGLAGLLVEINQACEDARRRGLKQLAPTRRNTFAARYDTLVTAGLAANPEPVNGRKRDSLERRSYNLATAFKTHRKSILRYMYNLDVAFTNNQAERDLRPVKLHRKISGCFRNQTGAQRYATVRSYLSTTRKHDIPAIQALTDLFNDNPWMPPTPTH